jgi:hypothetical protein
VEVKEVELVDEVLVVMVVVVEELAELVVLPTYLYHSRYRPDSPTE